MRVGARDRRRRLVWLNEEGGKIWRQAYEREGKRRMVFFFLHNDEMNLCAIIFTYVLLFGWAYQGVGMVFFFSLLFICLLALLLLLLLWCSRY